MKFNIWKDYPLKPLTDLLTFIVDNRGKSVPLSENGKHILIATNCIRNESLYPSYENIRFFDDEVYENWFRAHPLPGDVIFVNKGTPGRTCMVPEPVDFSIAQDMMAFRTNEEVLHNRYLLCVLRSYEIQEQIRMYSVGDVIPHFKKQFLKQLLIPVPPLKIQKYIADIYFAFSEKIEINKEINKNLAELLQSICKNQFSSTPQGKLSDICTYSKERIAVDELSLDNYYSTENMLPNKAGANAATSLPSTPQTTRCNTGDVLVSNIRPYFKKILYCYSEGGCSSDVLCFTPKYKKVSAFLYGILYTDAFFDFMVAGSKGTKMPRGDKQQLMTYPIYIPTNKELDEYNEMAVPILNDVYRNMLENEKLAALRDTLLPQLMLGEVIV